MPARKQKLKQPSEAETDREHVALLFGQNAYECRVLQRMTQDELARKAGIHRTQITLIETGKRLPGADTIVRVAAALNVPIERLFREIEWAPPVTDDKTDLGSYVFGARESADRHRSPPR